MSVERSMNTRTPRTTVANVKRIVLASVALVFAASCQHDSKGPFGPKLQGLAHVPVFSTVQSTSGATFTTDKDDYSPGETLNLSGSGWQSNDVLDIHLDETPQNHDPVDWTINVDTSGGFTDATYIVQESDLGVTFTITATSQATGDVAQATFTDDAACPASGTGNPQTSNRVGATATVSGNDVTYKFESFVTEGSGGVPGLIKYCVYPDVQPDGGVTVVAIGANGAAWTESQSSGNFSFNRPNGNPTNIPYDGASHEMGTATWNSGVPTDYNKILLHINDAAECAALYGGNPGTCFVLPGERVKTAEGPSVSKDAHGAYDRTFTWTILKSVDHAEVKTAGGGPATFNYTASVSHDAGAVSAVKVTGTITVTNPNAAAMTLDAVTDKLSDGTVCTVTGGTLSLPAGPNSNTTFGYECDLGGLPQVNVTNTVTISWSDQDLSDASHLPKGSADFTAPDNAPTISFTANNIDECVSVTDTYSGGPQSVPVCAGGDLNPKTFTYSQTVNDPAGTCTSHDNTVSFTTTDLGATDSKKVTVTDCQGADLTVSKTATPSFKRTYNWSIQKSVDKTTVKQVGGSATFNYTVVVNQTGFTDSDWKVNGTITVSNPNDWEDITLTDLSDAVGNGGTCTVNKSAGLTVPKSGSKSYPYECTYASAPNPSSGTNTATATWDKTTYSTPNGSASGTSDFAFTTPTTLVNKTVTVTDSYKGTLGTVTATDGQPFASKTFPYSRTISVPQFDCLSYPNTATIVETGQQSGVTVTVCGPAKTGALTMGFWQNKNGQKIITGGAATSGVCNSGTWLRRYAPFQDLSATATCAQVGTYVTNVIKAANSSGSSMNPMLKGQMLATALDVYFSDAALGGNMINAPEPIGGKSIDLTMICKMIDGSGGTATCSGTYQNASSAFGGATSLTVSQILAYAASQSNAGGSVWYGQVKATQELAKNTFDAINNQVAFAP